jgi:Domain of unknown function (DUF4783)
MGMILSLITALILSLTGGDVPYAAIENAFSNGDAAKIVSYGKDKILLNVQDKEGVYASAQATQVLKEFFNKKPASSFKYTFKGLTADGANAMANYQSKGEIYRVTLKWTKSGGEYKIESISIEKS